MKRVAFLDKLLSVGLLDRRDIDEIRMAAAEFRKLYNSQDYDDIVLQIHGCENLSSRERVELYIDLCNKWSCRISRSVRAEATKVIRRVERLVWEIDKDIEQEFPR